MISRILAKNRPSPLNEDDYIYAYKKLVPSAQHEDNYDVACVVSFDGIYGHAMMLQSDNRCRDNQFHFVYNFIADYELRRVM